MNFYVITYIVASYSWFHNVRGFLRYTEQSCLDLTPRNQDEYTEPTTGKLVSRFERISNKRVRFRRSSDIPYRLVVDVQRYRRDSDIVVSVEGDSFDGLMLQARSRTPLHAGIGIVGQFLHIRHPFKPLTCLDMPASTVIDEGKPIVLGNTSFVWRSPEYDVGDIRFLGSVLKGIQYWVVVSPTLTFNPFPISRHSCGSTLGCFRLCPSDEPICIPRDAIYVFTYHVHIEKRQIEFTIGGRLLYNNSYIAVGFGEDYEALKQTEMIACWIDRGIARVEHLTIESIFLPPFRSLDQSTEVDDYDLHQDENGENRLWCRFRRSMNPEISSYFDITKSLYHFYWWGTIDLYFNRFQLPERRSQIFASTNKRNFTHAVNEILSDNGSSIHLGLIKKLLAAIIVNLFLKFD